VLKQAKVLLVEPHCRHSGVQSPGPLRISADPIDLSGEALLDGLSAYSSDPDDSIEARVDQVSAPGQSRQLAAPPAPARPERIFHDATLREIARARPSSLDALRAISGVGARKLEAYGADIVGLVEQFSERPSKRSFAD
jgi:superfamily II DNA helicase RecQ